MDTPFQSRCEAQAHYGQCRQEAKYEHQGYRFCTHHYTRLKKNNSIKVITRLGFVVWKDEEVK